MGGPSEDDPYARWLGLSLARPGEARLTIRADLVNEVGRLLGPVGFALVDYAMGSLVWAQLDAAQMAVTVNIALNFVASVDSGEVVCRAVLDRPVGRSANLRSEVLSVGGRLLISALGTFAVIG